MSAPSALHRSAVSRSVLLAVISFTMVSFTDAATIMLNKSTENTIMKTKGSVAGSTAASAMKVSSVSYNFNAQNFSSVANITDAAEDVVDDGKTTDEDALSAVWYLAAFGSLVLFFFVITCSELFLGSPMYPRRPVDLPHAGYLRRHVYGIRNQQRRGGDHYTPDTPPPPYHLFAPPSYDDTVKGVEGGAFAAAVQQHQQQHEQYLQRGASAKKLADVYVVPVHCPPTSRPTATSGAAAAAADAKLLAAVLPQTKFK